jgi:outer membrane protein assembly factor BamB
MSMSNNLKWLVGLATVWLIAYPVFFLILWLLSFQAMFSGGSEVPFIGAFFGYLFPLHCLTAILQLVLLAFYLVHILRNQLASEAAKVGFALSIVILPYIGMPAYYYLFVWRPSPPQWALSLTAKEQLPPSAQARQPGRAATLRNCLPVAIALGLVMFVLVAGAVVVASVAPTITSAMREGFYEPSPPTYATLSIIPDMNMLVHRPAASAHFQHLSSFSQVETWRNAKESPIAIRGDLLVLAGHFSNSATNRTTVDLVVAEIATGDVMWQKMAGDNHIAVGADRIYFSSAQDPGAPLEIAASDLRTGAELWHLVLPEEYAIGIEYMALVDDWLAVRTYHRGNGAFYNIDPHSGEIATSFLEPNSIVAMSEGQTIEWFGDLVLNRGSQGWRAQLPIKRSLYDFELGAPLILDDMLIVQNGYRFASPVTALQRSDGRILWQYDGISASNLATDGDLVFFITDRGRLTVLNRFTGEVVDSLQFEPTLSTEYDLVNDHLLVAASDGFVAAYFRDVNQLSVLRYEKLPQD